MILDYEFFKTGFIKNRLNSNTIRAILKFYIVKMAHVDTLYGTRFSHVRTLLTRYATFLASNATLLVRYATLLVFYFTLFARYYTLLARYDKLLAR
jgi:hypothetical protein